MFKLQISSPIWLLSIACCFNSFQQAQAAAITDPDEVNVLKSLSEKWSIQSSNTWNLIGDPCIGRTIDSLPITDNSMTLAFKCNCSFDNGTTCHIEQMRVHAVDINGEIPEELAKLTYLWHLDLSQNYLTGPFPAFLGNLTKLKILSVGTNMLSGPVPKELGNLHKLFSLSFDLNSLNGTLPPELGNLRALNRLYINSAGLSGEIPSTFGNLQNLSILWAFDNQFTGRIPDFIGSWKNLTDLRLHGTALNGPIPSSFSNLKSLTYLRVSDITSGLSSLSFLKGLKNLNQLVLRNNMISGEIPLYIGEISGLEHFDLSYNQLSGALPTWLGDKNLEVNLVGNYFAKNETDNRFPGRGLGCLQRTFPCFGGASTYSSFAINCGGPRETSATGDVYEQDNETLNGASFYVSNRQNWGVSDTGYFMASINPIYEVPYNATYEVSSQSQIYLTDPALQLYQTARLSASSLRYYGLGLENGPYEVVLQFAETMFVDTESWRSIGRRIFDVYVQGHKVLMDFDIRKDAGGSNKPIVQRFKTNVIANLLEIHFFWTGKGSCFIPPQGNYGPLVSAISVTPDLTKKSKTGIVIGITVGIVAALICIFLVSFLWRRRVQKLAERDVEEDEVSVIRSKLKIFSYGDMKTATRDFNRENKLGAGGFGAVYKGILSDGTIVAVKQLSPNSRQGKREFMNEVAVISAVQHRNLVTLHGCCLEADNRLLVYEYFKNNSLEKALLGNKKSHLQLDWPTRYTICIGTARGLAYLHEESSTRIIHRDIKASNILLDDSLNPKIADFGLAKLYDEKKTHISTRVAGTVGYVSPEYAMRGHLTEKADVFSFGVVALELVSGRGNTDTSLPQKMVYLLEWTWHLYEQGRSLELIDPDIESTCSKNEVCRVIEIALLCTQAVPTMRPKMSQVVAMLTSAVEIIPAASRPGYIKDWQSLNSTPGTGSTPVVATTSMQNSTESLSLLRQDSLTLFSAERKCNPVKD